MKEKQKSERAIETLRFDCAGSSGLIEDSEYTARTGEVMFLGHCKAEMFQDYEPQVVVITEDVKNRVHLSAKGWDRLVKMVDNKLPQMEEGGDVHLICQKFPFWAGRSERIETRDSDDVFYAKVNRGPMPIWGRFVRNQKGGMTQSQTVILRSVEAFNEDGQEVGWLVVAAYAGKPAPPFPGDPNANSMSREYWSTHALLDGALPYDEATVTADCPW